MSPGEAASPRWQMSARDRNRVVHLELHTDDLSEARSFYEQLFEWRAEPIPVACGAYLSMALGGRIGGGIVECPTPRPVWLPYVSVQRIGKVTDRARLLGASILLEPREGPAGWRSVVAAPGAGEIALWEAKR